MARRPAKTLSAPQGEEYTPIFEEGVTPVTVDNVVTEVPDAAEDAPSNVADLPAAGDWDALLGMVETDTIAPKAVVVEPPSGVVKLLESLSAPGADGGKQRAKLPVRSMAHYDEVRLTLRRASRRMVTPKTVSTKPVFAKDDMESYVSDAGRNMTRPRKDAVPTHISFSVGEKRGPAAAESDDE